jgi:very-short-patch-repair endonuclease
MAASLTPQEFVEKWRNTTLGERQSYQAHFMDLCHLVGYNTPDGSGKDQHGNEFVFEYSLKKTQGGQGFADVFLQNHFAIEYKAPGKYPDLRAAYHQLQQYREQLQNPPLLVVTDLQNWEIHTNWQNTEKKIYKFTHEEIATRSMVRDWLRSLFFEPNRLHPNRNAEQVTAEAARSFELIANNMRDWSAEPERIAHFLTKIVFSLFAEDVGLLPNAPNSEEGIFSYTVINNRMQPKDFVQALTYLFQAMAEGGKIPFVNIQIPYFNGSLFEDVRVEELSLEAISNLERAARLNWSSVEPAIFGTLFERSLDPSKRSQLGAHYTSREDILLIVEPVLMRPLRRKWEQIQQQAQPISEKYEQALQQNTSQRDLKKWSDQLESLRESILHDLRTITVLDPACGSGNFLYVALQSLMDLEKEVLFHPLFEGLTRPFPEVHPRQMYGMEIDEIAHALASIVVWIGWLQWREQNGYNRAYPTPILQDLSQNIRLMDAILSPPAALPAAHGGNLESPSPRSGEGFREGSSSAPQEFRERIMNTRISTEIWEKLKPLARDMRHNPTPAEDALWQRLRRNALHGFHFRRQHPVGHFIADFFCAEARLVVEVDGAIHDQQEEYDQLRQAYIESLGLRVIRFTNDEVLQQLEAVLERIAEELSPPPALPATHGGSFESPSPQRGEGFREGSSSAPHRLEEGSSSAPHGFREGSFSAPQWQPVDVIIGNPPFLGDKKMRGELGDAYVDQLRKLYNGRVPGGADLVCYWFEQAREQIAQGKARRVGLLATNSIRSGANREVLKRIKETGDIFMAWADREWTLEGASVRVSMVGFDDGGESQKELDGLSVSVINADLTSGIDLGLAQVQKHNQGLTFQGPVKVGSFDITDELAQHFLKLTNLSGKNNRDVIRPWANGTDIVQLSRKMWIIDFANMTLSEAELYEGPIDYVRKKVKPNRDKNNDKQRRENWWRLGRSGNDYRNAVSKLQRQVFTPRVAKHRVFVWMNKDVIPDSRVYAIARDDDYFFGVLHSRIHEIWSLRQASRHGVGNDPTYNNTTCFETFPFPWSPGAEAVTDARYQAIAQAAKQLHEERDAWLNPPTLSAAQRKERTLTNLYNALNVFRGVEKMKIKASAGDFAPRLDALHRALDEAVCAAYGWDQSILADEDAMLRHLLTLNLQRA